MSNNVLLIGPSGCGKSYALRAKLNECDAVFLSLNLNTTYELLVEGIAVDTASNSLLYKTRSGEILKLIDKALRNPDKVYYILMDDIQNVCLSEVLGELYYGFSNRGSTFTLKSGNSTKVPFNIKLIATASTSDIKTQDWRNSITLFDEIQLLDNDKDTYVKVLYDIRKRNENEISDVEFDKLVDSLKDEYERYVVNGCVFTPEFANEKENFRIGYTLFLPAEGSDFRYWLECVKHKIRHQVIPLLSKYADDGIIIRKHIPSVEYLDTDYIFVKDRKKEISVIEDANFQYKRLDSRVFDNGEEMPIGEKSVVNASHNVNCEYVAMFRLVRDVIENPVISDSELMDLFTKDSDILTFRNDIHNTDTGLMGGCLFVNENIANCFPVKDQARGNSGSYSYSKSYNSISYKHKKYIMFNPFNIPRRKKVLPFLISDCIEKNAGIQKREFYKTAKVFAFKYLKKIEAYLKDYKQRNPNNVEVNDMLQNLNIDLSIVAGLTDDSVYVGERCYINLGATNNESKLSEKKFVEKIRNLPTWANLKKISEVTRVMCNRYKHIMDLTGIRQLVFQGPPGTSKTYGAKRLICEIADIQGNDWEQKLQAIQLKTDAAGEYVLTEKSKKCYWDIVQFHPSYSYEDFVRGISVFTVQDKQIKGKITKNNGEKMDVVLEDSNAIGYKAVNKVIGKMAKIAIHALEEADSPADAPIFVLVVDEINRANLASVFGELIYALEYRDTPITTPYTVDSTACITIPSNMYIVGTMNTADKSIGDIDYAIRRRFLFFKMLPDLKVVVSSVMNSCPEEDLATSHEVMLYCLVQELFDKCLNSAEYDKEDVQIGHTYFIRNHLAEKAQEHIKMKFLYQIVPILNEYIKDGVLDFNINDLEQDIWHDSLCTLNGILNSNVEEQENLYAQLISDLTNGEIYNHLHNVIIDITNKD